MNRLGMIALLPTLMVSTLVLAKAPTDKEILATACEELAYQLDEELGVSKASDYEKKCLKVGQLKITDVKSSAGDVVSKKVKLSAEVEAQVESSIDLAFVKTISFTADGKESISWKTSGVKANIIDHREGKDLLISLLDNLNYGQGDAGTGTFDPATYDIEEDADKRKDNGENEDYSIDYKDAVSLLYSYEADEKFLKTLEKMKKNKEIFGTLTTTPNEDCEESEYCSYGSVEIYLNDGTSIYVHFDFTT